MLFPWLCLKQGAVAWSYLLWYGMQCSMPDNDQTGMLRRCMAGTR